MTNGEDMFHVGHDRVWPLWFKNRVNTSEIITRCSGWKAPVSSADVMIAGRYQRAKWGDYIVLHSDGSLGIIKKEDACQP